MPQISYYLGRPASFWIAVMSRHAGNSECVSDPIIKEARRDQLNVKEATGRSVCLKHR
jgi:hypothetical protein